MSFVARLVRLASQLLGGWPVAERPERSGAAPGAEPRYQ